MLTLHTVKDGKLKPAGSECSHRPESLVWVDLHNPTREEEQAVERMLGIEVPTKEEMAEIEESSRLYEEDGALVMTAVLAEATGRTQPSRAQLTFVLTRHCLVTVRYTDLMLFRSFEAKQAKMPELHTSSETVFGTLLESILERIADLLEATETEIGEVSTAIFYGDENVRKAEERSVALRQLLIRLGRKNRMLAIIRESLLSLNRLVLFARPGAPWIKDEALERLESVERDIRSLSEYEARTEAEIAYLQDATLGLINIEQNTIIKVFSIAAVLFLPPTLVGTIYGMNFEHMPELSWRIGYPMALGMMVISAVVPYCWFKRKGWL
jgi:magnesium transporter